MKRKKGFTLIELLVVIAIIAILAAILFPVFANAKKSAQQSMCSNNMKQMGIAMLMYTSDNDGRFPIFNYAPPDVSWGTPTSNWWPAKIKRYCKNDTFMVCPSAVISPQNKNSLGKCTYGLNFRYLNDSNLTSGIPASTVRKPSATVELCEVGQTADYTQTEYNYVAYPPSDVISSTNQWVNRPVDWHNGGCNVTFVDGHVKLMKIGSDFYPKAPWKGNGLNSNFRTRSSYKDQLWDTY